MTSSQYVDKLVMPACHIGSFFFVHNPDSSSIALYAQPFWIHSASLGVVIFYVITVLVMQSGSCSKTRFFPVEFAAKIKPVVQI